jgi:hypothetical protein
VKVGEVYAVKVSDKVAPVVIDEEHPGGGWAGTNQETKRQVRVKSAQRLRCPWDDYLARGDAALGKEEPEAPRRNTGAKGAKKSEGKARRAKAAKKAPRAKTGAHERRPSGLDAAAKVLSEAGEPLSCRAIAERALEKGYWKSGGKTPHATIYSAILREIQKKGDEARFRKAARGKFELAR